MDIYRDTLEAVGSGAKWSVDFKTRTLKVNGKVVPLEGDLGIEVYDDLDKWLDDVEGLYDAYKFSRPTISSMSKARFAKFKALSLAEMTEMFGHDALTNPIDRDTAQCGLELFILLSLVNGSLKPEELFAKDWFYQGADKSFILRKNMF